MTVRTTISLGLAALAMPVAAQTTLPGLENFTLDRRPPAPNPTPSASPAPAATAVPTPPPAVVALPTPRVTASPRARPAPLSVSTPDASRTPIPNASAAPLVAPTTAPAPTAAPLPELVPVAADPPAAVTGTAPNWSRWVGVVAILLGLGAAAWWWRRRRQAQDAAFWDDAPAAVADVDVAPAPVPPVERPKSPGGFITTALRPELAFELLPLAAGIDALRASIDFQLTVGNIGRASAHDVTVATWLIGAGRDPRADLVPVFAQAGGAPLLAPFVLPAAAKADLTSQALAPREALAVITAGERQLFVPLLAVRATWRDGRGQLGTTTAAFLIGVPRAGQERLAPLALDRGSRGYARLEARRLDAV